LPISSATEVAPASLSADLAVRGLAKRFGETPILNGVDLTVGRGEAVAIVGANGAGKSTLLRCCLRLIEPDGGSTALLGEEVGRLSPRALRRLRARIGFVFQRHNLAPRLSALSNVLHGAQGRIAAPLAWWHATAPSTLRADAMAWLDPAGLADPALRRVDRLSGGQSQRVAIARALMQRPAMVFADEPVASLDPAAAEQVMQMFVELMRRETVTLVFTTHHIPHALGFADRVIGLAAGRVAIDQPAGALDRVSLRAFYG